ncbi:MAG TPA: c-type cytochrome [Pirellulales bacterium]
MDFPTFHIEYAGDRMLVAVVAVLHVLINHALAVGAMPLVVWMEYLGWKHNDPDWDRLARKTLTVCFIIATTFGALSGVGIWFAVSLVNPAAIGSLLRVFFWVWFVEWIVFVTEVSLLLAYYLLWDRWQGERKPAHMRLGAALAVFSWITMALIVAILGFMMDPGDWTPGGSLLTAVLNPIYLPQLFFRTAVAMCGAGLFVMLLAPWVAKSLDFRRRAVRTTALWTLAWVPLLTVGAIWYRSVIPQAMAGNVPVALATQTFAGYEQELLWCTAAAVGVVLIAALWGAAVPGRTPAIVGVAGFTLTLVLLGTFERVREFIRKPYVIGDYMYANGLRVSDVPLLQRDGLLKHAVYTTTREIRPDNRVEAGRNVFMLACSRCHTVVGMNSVAAKVQTLLGEGPWDREKLSRFIENMHGARPFMPPFPGNAAELDALAAYIVTLDRERPALLGAQATGAAIPATLAGAEKAKRLIEFVESSEASLRDRQECVQILASVPTSEADDFFQRSIQALNSRRLPKGVALDVYEQAAKRTTPGVSAALADAQARLAADADLGKFRLCEEGGDPQKGRSLFESKACVSCHVVSGVGGRVGPELTTIASRATPEEIVRSIVRPSATIAKGYQSLSVVTIDGLTVSGVVKRSDASGVELMQANGQSITVPRDEVEEELEGQSLMPATFTESLSLSELRDVVAYLSTLH